MTSRRMSIGGRSNVLQDASTVLNRQPSVSRRMSMSMSLHKGSETPKRDQRALLEEWRRNRENDNTGEPAIKRPCGAAVPKVPPTFVAEETSALERFRTRKLQKLQQQHYVKLKDEYTIPGAPSSFLDEPDETLAFNASHTSSTPYRSGALGAGARRRSVVPGQRQQRLSSSSLFLPSSQETISTTTSFGQNLTQSTTGDEDRDDEQETLDTVEGAGLRSRLREMQQRVDQLEREKMLLSMSKAPLEAQFRQKQEEWIKEQNRLVQEIESLKYASRDSDERYRDLQLKHEALEIECKHLRHEIRKASSSLHNARPLENTGWSRQLQNDRDVEELKQKLRSAEEEIDSIRLAKVSVEKELHATKIELDSVVRSYNELQTEYEEMVQSTSENRDAEIKLEVLTTEHIATSAQLNAVCADLAATRARAEAAIDAKDEQHRKMVEELQFEVSVLKTRAAKGIEDGLRNGDIEDEAVLRARIEEKDRRIAELEAQALKSEELRRQMHNRIQELRGNVRVFVRTRPFLPSDGEQEQSAIDVSLDGESMSIVDVRSSAVHEFKFDKVFPPSAGQDSVFQEVSDFVQSALDGYNVCLFSYGQTGSGKTHTMQGSGNGAMRGIIPRAVEQILDQAKVMQHQKWTFQLSASFLEIYNEELKDLLVSTKLHKSDRDVKLAIKRSREGKSFVDGLTEIPIETDDTDTGMRQLDALMEVAARARSVASTKMNAQSSRSHSVFMLHLRGYNAETGAEVQGELNLCDLAGSERLDRSGANDDAKRLRETQAINKSLSCLGDVFTALAQRASHIPYRNSKLTYLLQDCLSGDGKALMFVNLSPTTTSSNESLCSLRFAQRVNQVELGKPTKHIQFTKKY